MDLDAGGVLAPDQARVRGHRRRLDPGRLTGAVADNGNMRRAQPETSRAEE